MLRTLPAALRKFEGRQLVSSRSLPFDVVSTNTGTTDKTRIEEICRQHGVSGIEWAKDGALRITCLVPTIIRHPQTGEPVWFNRVRTAAPWGVVYERLRSTRYCATMGLKVLEGQESLQCGKDGLDGDAE